ncbi:hypothetical protein HMPREF2086_00005 [Helicobacter macacae MIT 99-5501]|uniref:Uncharacterized protein n=1 Tax=Helicobacter macacae MIT 99-5501 TaxID=1357400 RepID=V8CB85_9HELI|nr:hypothetical protein HMPREF2086_00005 [Helicobacter macacae MIT 99-5501]
MNPFKNFAKKVWQNFIKFAEFIYFNVEKLPKIELGISL